MTKESKSSDVKVLLHQAKLIFQLNERNSKVADIKYSGQEHTEKEWKELLLKDKLI